LRTRAIVAYLLLVGIPLAGVIVLVTSGGQLSAPPDISGAWLVEEGATCGLHTGDVFRVAQSGRFVQVEISGRPVLGGSFDGSLLRAAGGVREASSPGCNEGRLNVRLRVADDGARFEGTGGIEDCSACPPRPISASRMRGG
jgi:hypothetical protein